MTPSYSTPSCGTRWLTYLKAVAFLCPALLAWGFSEVFLFPKLRQIWIEAGFSSPAAHRFLGVSDLLMQKGLWIAIGIVLTVGLLEWRTAVWPRYRRACVSVGVFLVNSAVLVLLTSMLVTALIAAPALLHR